MNNCSIKKEWYQLYNIQPECSIIKEEKNYFMYLHTNSSKPILFFPVSIEENSTELSLEEKELVPTWMLR